MAIVTHWSQNGLYDAFSIFDTQNTLDAPLGLNWGTTFHTPADPSIHAQWKNIGDVFGIAIDNQKMFTSPQLDLFQVVVPQDFSRSCW